MLTARQTFIHFLQDTGAGGSLTAEQQSELFREGLLGMACRQRGLKELYLEAVGREHRWRSLLRKLDEGLAHHGQHALVFKGGSALGHLYPASGLRPLSDLDLVVEPTVESALKDLGFSTLSGYPWVMANGAFQLDLHVHPLGRHCYAFPWNLQRARQLSAPLSERRGLFRFQSEDEMVLALLHAGKHAYSRLIWLADIHLLLPRCEPELLRQRLREAGAERYLDYARWLLAQLQGEPGPSLNALEKKLLRLCLQRRAPETLGMLLPLLSMRSLPRALNYLRHCLRPQNSEGYSARVRDLWSLLRRSTSP